MSKPLYSECSKCNKTILNSSNKCQHCGARQYKRRIFKWISIFIGVVFLVRLISEFSSTTEQDETLQKLETLASEITPPSKDTIIKQIELEYSWNKEGFGSIMQADFVIKNSSAYDIKDISITCEHYSLSNTNIDSNSREIYEIFPSNSTKRYDAFNMGFIHEQVNSSSCFVKNFEFLN